MSPGRAIACKHVQDLLDDYRRGKLLPGQRQLIADHLAGCSDCKAELELRENLAKQMLGALPDSRAPEGLTPAVIAAIAAASRADSPARPHRKNSSLLPVMLTAAAAIITGVALYQVGAPTATESAIVAAMPDAPVSEPVAVMSTYSEEAMPPAAAPARDMSFSVQEPVADAMAAQTFAAPERQELAKESVSRESYFRQPEAPAQPAATQPAREMESASPAGMAATVEDKAEARARAVEPARPAMQGGVLADRRLSRAEHSQQAATALYSAEERAAIAPAPAQNAVMLQGEAAPASRAPRKMEYATGAAASTATAATTSTAETTATVAVTTATSEATTGTTAVRQGVQP